MINFLSHIQQWFDRKKILRARQDSAYAGRLGETLAVRHLRTKIAAKIIFRNWRSGHGELDVVCQQREILIFVEVRTRRHEALVQGYHSINKSKRKTLKATCIKYLRSLPQMPNVYRFDVIEIMLKANGSYEINHFENVPLFDK